MSYLLPETFQARGVLVPFENPRLKPLRLRLQPGYRTKEWEAIFENYAGTDDRKNLIMQWVHVPNWARMAIRDRALFDAITQMFADEPLSPIVMWTLASAADRDHAEDPAAREAAKARLETARKDRFQAYISLLAQATREYGVAHGDPVLAKANSIMLMAAVSAAPEDDAESGQSLTEKVFAYLAERAKVPQPTVIKRIEAVSETLAPIGAINLDADPGARQEGHLALSYVRLDKFREAVREYEKHVRDEAANRALLVQFSAAQFREYVADRLSDIEQKLSFFVAVVRDHAIVHELIAGWARDIAFALDGWSELIDVWDKALEKFEAANDLYVLDLAIQHILLYLPTMPREAIDAEEERVWHGLTFQRSKMVRQLINWIDGEIDKELKSRFEAARKAKIEREAEAKRAAQKKRDAQAAEQARREAGGLRRAKAGAR